MLAFSTLILGGGLFTTAMKFDIEWLMYLGGAIAVVGAIWTRLFIWSIRE
ncbi:MAG: hypothetical protein M3R13_09620 [Armatimonadota bacterium]|nr:hypothetical protein [Armatimonadota bacterium]